MKKWYSLLSLVITGLVLLLTFTSCGASSFDKAGSAVEPTSPGYTADVYDDYTNSYDEPSTEAADGTSDSVDINLHNKVEQPSQGESVSANRKIIVRNDLSIQTKEFDTLMDSITAKVNELGGYIESATVYGQAMDSRSTRSADLVLRIPAKADAEFLAFLDENSVITRRSVDTEDVTLKYVDTESRLSALRAEKEALEKLLNKATEMQDIILITEKMTEVIRDIEAYQSQLRVYDNLVDYCTVSLYIDEVEFTTQVEKQSAWLTIWNNLQVNFANMWDGVVAVFVFLISAIPYLIPFAVIGLVILLIIRNSIRRRRKAMERAKKAEESNAE